MVLNAVCGNAANDYAGSVGFSLVDMLIGSIKRCAVAPWLVPVNRGHFEAGRRGLAETIRDEAHV